MVDIKYPTTPVELYNYMYDSCVYFVHIIIWNIILTFNTIRDFFVNFLTENQRVWGVCSPFRGTPVKPSR